MGGMRDGALCAAIAISSFFTSCIRLRDLPLDQRLIAAVRKANEIIFDLFRGQGGATLSAVLRDAAGNALGVNVGDSRIYVVANTEIRQLTVDDTLGAHVQKLKISPVDDNLRSNELLQFVGVGASIEPHIIDLPSSRSERLILTTDGVHFLPQSELRALTLQAEDPRTAAFRLTELANWNGGRDNASAITMFGIPDFPADHRHIGAIEISDPFGEVQIIGIDREAIGGDASQPSPYPPLREPIQEVTRKPKDEQNKSSGLKAKKLRRIAKLTKKGRASTGNTKSATKTTRGKPQLKIRFD
jgi:serine/threonine protein phosphatase PrpC